MRTTVIFTSLLGLAIVGCSDRPLATEARSTPPESARFAKPGTLPSVSLIVTVSDLDGSGATYGIRSDGLGTYTDGTQNVQAVLDQYGTFAFNTNTARRAAIRSVIYSFNDPVDPANTYRPSPTTENYHFSTGPSSFSPFTKLQNLGLPGYPVSECMYMGNGLTGGTSGWLVSFHKGLEDVSGTPTAFAVATRTSVTPAEWTITPVGSCSPNSNVASLRSGTGATLYGYYRLPFFFTLRAK